jgi:hypothetical protein
MSMRERIARAIVAADFGGDATVFDEMHSDQQAHFYSNADAVLAEMMEPNADMLQAFAAEGAGLYQALASWQAAIQAARDGK